MKKITFVNMRGEPSEINIEKNLILVGANGAGKSRLGASIEQNNLPSKRISSQRYLNLSEVVQQEEFSTASQQLRASFRHRGAPEFQNDYEIVLKSLFAQEIERNSEYVDRARVSDEKLELPKSVKEKVLEVWNFIYPYRELKLERNKVKALADGVAFSPTQFSDGEKVGLYLISQVLLADPGCVLVIDEPELHLHKSLMIRLWNKLEQQRKDCYFVYITHDLDFASGKSSDKRVWIKKFSGVTWEMEEIENHDYIPENLFLEILGSRKPVIFVEGTKGSLDSKIYQAVYENFTVIPCGSCLQVIEAVKGINANPSLHNNNAFGILDMDFRSLEEIDSLKKSKIYCIGVNQVENLLLVPEVLDIICRYLHKEDKKDEMLAEVHKIFTSERDAIGFSVSKNAMYLHIIKRFISLKKDADFEEFKTHIFSELEVIRGRASGLEEKRSLGEILEIYPHKGLVTKIQNKLELSKDGYKNLFLSLLNSEDRDSLIVAIRPYLPILNHK